MHREFWEAGYHVFGLHGATKDGACGCGNQHCKAQYKHPLVSNWQNTPHWSEEQLEAYESIGQFDTGYGILCKNLLVIDVDARNSGVLSYDKLIHSYPQISSNAGLIVETGSGNGSKHVFFKLNQDFALLQHLQGYDGLDFKSSGFVVGAGSMHASGNRYKVLFGSPEDIQDAPQELIDLLRKPDRHRAVVNGMTYDVSHKDLAEMLSFIDPDTDHDTWVRCGMACHHASGGTAFGIWDSWSSRGTKYPGSEVLTRRWHSFGKATNPVTLGTLTYHAEQGGWVQPVTFEPNEIVEEDPPTPTINLDGIDLKRPPGFVGEVTAWINSQCRYPRENLAVAAALTSIGNIVGLRYADELQDVTTNLFSFCVAGSGTGKEAIQQAALSIHRAAKISGAVHGNIKSEQEIARNLTDHQASFYVIDEIGIMLKKIKNAQARGGAVYLDGVIGLLMSVYSKANGYLPITGDLRKEVKKSVLAEINQIERQLDSGDDAGLSARLESAKKSLNGLDNGIDKPFLSLLGFTTPVTFDDLVDFESATNGFIGRSLLFNERETVPPEKEDFIKPPMPERMENAIFNLYSAGTFDMTVHRVEYYGDKMPIPTSDDGKKLLKTIMRELHQLAEDHKDKTGLETLFLRAKEAVAKVSFILAVPSGVRTVEHILWAYALVKRDVEEKSRLVIGNTRRKDSPSQALAARIMNIVAGDDGETLGVIVSRLRPTKKEEIEKCISNMVNKKMLVCFEILHPRRKSISKRYKLAKGA